MSARGKEIVRPEINPKFTYGKITGFRFRNSITPTKGKYSIRFTLDFENKSNESLQRGGFNTQKEAYAAKELLTARLNANKFVPFEFKVREFYDYWLYYYMIDEKEISYNTFTSYNNIIGYLVKEWGENTKLIDLSREKIISALESFSSDSLRALAYSVVGSSFKFAEAQNMLDINAASSAIRVVKNKLKKEKEQKIAENGDDFAPPKQRPVLDANQAAMLLYTCKKEEPSIYMALLFTVASGLRISEALGVKFKDIDFGKQELLMRRQVGRSLKNEGFDSDELSTQELEPKSDNGYRNTPLASFVIEEIILARANYEKHKRIIPDFKDKDFITFQKSGKPFNRSQVYKKYHNIFKLCDIPYIEWHDLRHTYSTLLAQYGVSMKAISICMGHYSEEFTKKTYVSLKDPVYDAVDEMIPFINEVLPGVSKVIEDTIPQNYVLAVLP